MEVGKTISNNISHKTKITDPEKIGLITQPETIKETYLSVVQSED